MKTHTVIKSTVAALVLAFVPSIPAQTAESSASGTTAESKAAPSAPAPAADPQAADLGTMNVSICYEAFSLPIAKAGELQRKGMTDEELYKELVSAGKLERLLVVRIKPGQRVAIDNVTQYKFPTEFSAPGVPGGVGDSPPEPNKLAPAVPLPLAPTAFEKIEVGDIMEAEPVLSPDAKSVDFQLMISHVAFAKREKWGQGLAELEQPQIELQKLSTNITASIGSPRFVGTLNPPFGNGLAARAEQNVWFCFITPGIAQNNAPAPTKAAR